MLVSMIMLPLLRAAPAGRIVDASTRLASLTVVATLLGRPRCIGIACCRTKFGFGMLP